MSVLNALAGVAVKDLAAASKWYECVIGQAGQEPMDGVVEWSLPRGGVLQLFEDPKRAGASSVTLSVENLDEEIARLEKSGVTVGQQTRSVDVATAIIQDLDGNQVVLAQPLSAKVAK